MVKSIRNVVWGLLACFAFAGSLAAQQHPLPGSKSEAPVICTGCVGTNASGQPNDGLPTYPYGPPLKDFVGRYVDSDNTAQFQHIGFRTARAGRIRTASERRGTAPPRMYIAIGEAVGAYSLDNFFSTRLPAGMVSVGTVKTGSPVGGFGRTPLEKILMWDGFLYPEAKAAQWHVPFQDGQTRLFDFDFDDRGYLYGAESVFGWGIVKDDGRTDATHFPKVVQMIQGGVASLPAAQQLLYPNTLDDTRGISTPKVIVALHSGTKYYVVTSDMVRSRVIYDVTDALTPKYVATLSEDQKNGIKKWSRDDASKRIAIIAGDDHLYIYDYADYVSGSGLPVVEYTSASFADISFDESGNLWAAEKKNKLWKLTQSGSSYVPNVYTPYGTPTFEVNVMHAAAGHVVVAGIDRNGGRTGGAAYDVKLLKVDASGPQIVDIDRYFQRYYHEAPTGYAEPGPYTGAQLGVQLVKQNGKTYLMYSVLGLGDVFEIEGGNSISLSMKTNGFGTTNPNAKPSENGPFLGDIVRFVANSSSQTTAYDVTWLFGNPEAGGSANQGISGTGNEISHQYTGYTTASQITTAKTVQAATIQDSTIGSTLLVNLKVPTPRIGISGVSSPITANATGVDLIAGSTFNDASDGSVESHYGIWTIDSQGTKLKPNETISTGAVGAHTLSFQGSYGKYDSQTLTGTSLYNTPLLTIGYTVKPFKAALNPPTSDGTTVTFTGTPSVTADTSVLSATQWTVNWTFTPGTSAGSVSTQSIASQSDPVAVGTIPSFQVPKSQVTPGSRITLEITVDLAGLSPAAQPYATTTVSSILSTPDPAMDKVGCANSGSPCKFTARSASGGSTSDWTFAWTLKKDGVTVKTATGNPFEPAITSPGNYSTTLKVTKSIFDSSIDQSFTAGGSLCGPIPDETDIGINKCFSNCTAGVPVEFSLTFRTGYTIQTCDTISWTFGDSTSGSGSPVSHTYNSAGTYTVSMKIQNSNGSLTKTTSITIGGSGGGDPGGGSSCTIPSNADFTYSGSTSSCHAGMDCRSGETISFSAKRGTGSPQSCDTVLWDFGDNTATSASKNPTHTYATVGTYTVSLKITNTKGQQTVTHDVVVVPPPQGNCSTAPTVGNFAVTFTGNSSNCSNTNATDCQAGETIAFESPNYYYVPGSCDSFDWDFGDGSTHVTTRTATHTYATGGQTYQVKFKVSNAAGNATYTKNVKIAGSAATKPIPVLTYTLFPTTGTKGKTVTFTVASNIPGTTGWTWSFGDGTANDTSQAAGTAQSSSITHTFANKGKYNVKVTARNAEDAPTAPVGTAQAQIDVADAPAIPEFKYLIPVAVHAKGQNNSVWRTDVQIYNPDPNVSPSNPLRMTATFKGTDYNLEMTKATFAYEDFLGRLLDHDDQGPIIITTKNVTTAPQIWTRTYNQDTQGGTFGQFIPAIRLDNAGSGGSVDPSVYYLSGLRHDARYRTNIGFLNPTLAAFNVTVTVYDERRLKLGEYTETLQPFNLVQYTLKSKESPTTFKLPTDAPFSVKVTVPAGQWVIAYASFIDGISNDPVFLQAIRESDVASADYKNQIVPGVGHTGSWRSDVTIFNPDVDAAQFNLQYFNSAGEKKGEALGIVLDPGKFLQYGDLLKQGVFGGNVEDGFGLLRLTVTSQHEKYPMTFSRTYFDDVANGTYGQGIGAFAVPRANVKPNKPALIAGVRNSANYRTNVGLINPTNATVTAKITVLDPQTGLGAGSIDYTLAPNQSILGSFNGFGSLDSGTLKVEANGEIWAFASIIDNRTHDPEYVAATPLN
jgi:PKD repeat protein